MHEKHMKYYYTNPVDIYRCPVSYSFYKVAKFGNEETRRQVNAFFIYVCRPPFKIGVGDRGKDTSFWIPNLLSEKYFEEMYRNVVCKGVSWLPTSSAKTTY